MRTELALVAHMASQARTPIYRWKCPGELPCMPALGQVPLCSWGTSTQCVEGATPPAELAVTLNLHTPAYHAPFHTHLVFPLKSCPHTQDHCRMPSQTPSSACLLES